ncbi:MAG TPA: (Fe-S)-binding protein [Anaerolineales bacterium]|nr:(Fe-S)-binding protein [Anaerolineales bacterium]
MTKSAVSPRPSFSREFYASLLEIQNGHNLQTCLQCGMCSGVCPFGYLMEYPPSRMIALLRAGVFDWVTRTDTVWLCVSCYACTEFCPARIPITAGLMTRTKEELLLEGNLPNELQTALENSQRYGNPLGESPRKRADWTTGISPPVKLLGKDQRQVEALWFVGDYPSYHPRAQRSTRALAKVFDALGVNFGILGPEESSDGDSQRLAGERGLFEILAEKNGRAFRKYQFKTIVTSDPHAFNALKNHYPRLGISYPAQHYTQFLTGWLEQLKPLLKQEAKIKVTYHDPCYLGRVNGIYDEPRQLLTAIPGVQLVEMPHHRTTSLCCGGGGGGMWMDGFQWEKAHTRLSEWRVREAVAAGADILAVACPYELPRFEDATKTIPGAGDLLVMDIAELLAEAIEF